MKYIFPLISVLNILSFFSESSGAGIDQFEHERGEMIETQIKARGIKDKNVLKAMNEVPRHKFIPQHNQPLDPYGDHPVPIGEGQTISQPYIVALMTELLEIRETDRVLEIGTGSGYQAAVLSRLSKEVYTIEIVEKLSVWAKERLLNYTNVFVKYGDGYLGWPDKAPFDKIIVTCAPDNIPRPLIDQLAIEGRMVIPVGSFPVQKLKVVEKGRDGRLIEHDIVPVLFVPMTRSEKQNKK